jgi:hypothetical protein
MNFLANEALNCHFEASVTQTTIVFHRMQYIQTQTHTLYLQLEFGEFQPTFVLQKYQIALL